MLPKKSLSLCAITLSLGIFSSAVCAQQKLFVYTSMKESMVSEIKTSFAKKHPDIKLDYQSAGAGKLMAKIAAERESGKILADVLWTSEIPDFYQLKSQGLLLPFIPTESKALLNPLPDYDGSFTAVRLGTLGIAYNTRLIKEPPKTWDDIKKPAFKGAFGIANPALSGTAYMSVAVLSKAFGWGYFEALRGNGAKMGKGSGQVVDDTASGDLVASLAVAHPWATAPRTDGRLHALLAPLPPRLQRTVRRAAAVHPAQVPELARSVATEAWVTARHRSAPGAARSVAVSGAPKGSHPFAASRYRTVRAALSFVPPALRSTVFIDIGCGDGRVLREALAAGFPRADGRELDPELARRAQLAVGDAGTVTLCAEPVDGPAGSAHSVTEIGRAHV